MKSKGSIPIGIILMVIIVGILFSLFYILVNLKVSYSNSMTLDFYDIVALKHTFNLTEKSLDGGLKAITSEAVFHPLDIGLPEITDSSGAYINESENSYLKIPIPWLNETRVMSGIYAMHPSWTIGEMNVPEFTEVEFSDYLKKSIVKFMGDHLANHFDGPVEVNLTYSFSNVVFENDATNFNVTAKIIMNSISSKLKPFDAGPYVFSYPIYDVTEYAMYRTGEKIVNGFSAGEISFVDSQLNFSTFMLKVADSFSAPLSGREKAEYENLLEDEYAQRLDQYSSAIDSTGSEAAFFFRDNFFRSTLSTFIDADYRKKYDAYLVNYTIIANVSDPSGQSFCCNWDPLGKQSSKEKPGLRFLLNDTFLGLDCDQRHASAIWFEHRDDSNHFICEYDGSGYSWYNISDYRNLDSRDMLIKLKNEDSYDSFWDNSEQKWYRCGYSLGDVVRVDKEDDISQMISSGEIDAEEKIENDIKIYPTSTALFEGSYETGSGSVVSGSSSFVSNMGQLICNIEGKTQATDSSVSGDSWLRCMDGVADFRKLSLYDGFGNFNDLYCCVQSVHPEQNNEYICSIDKQRADEYCCDCFGYRWNNQGYCVGDNYCDHTNGETSATSEDCCQKPSWYMSYPYSRYMNPGTEAYPKNDNICHAACGFVEGTSPQCDGDSLIQCDNSRFFCSQSQYRCSSDLCNQYLVERGCGDSTVGPGGECFINVNMNAQTSCGVRPCEYDSTGEGKCSTTKCSKNCGAMCDSDSDCSDICVSGSETLIIGRSCDLSGCTCTAGTTYVCAAGKGSNQCGGNNFLCLDMAGTFMWIQE